LAKGIASLFEEVARMLYKNYYLAKSLQACMAIIIMVCSVASLMGQGAPLIKNPKYSIPVDFTIKIQMKNKKPIKLARTFDNKILEVKDVLNDPTSVYLRGLAEGVATLELISTDDEKEELSVFVLRQQSPATNLKFLKDTTIDIKQLEKALNEIGFKETKADFKILPITTDSVLISGVGYSKEDIQAILRLASKIVDPNYLEKEGKVYEVDLEEDKDINPYGSGGTTIQNFNAPGAVSNDKKTISVSSKVINGLKFRKKSGIIEPTFDFKLLQKTIKDVFPKSNIEVKLLAKDSVVLMGYVSSAEDLPLIYQIATNIVDPALGQAQSQISQGSSTTVPSNSLNSQNQQTGSNTTGNSTNSQSSSKVINALRVAGVQQVQLDVVVAQVSRSEFRQLGFNFLSSRNSSFIASTLTGLAAQPTAVGTGLASGATQGSALAANGFVSSATAAANIPFGVLNSNSGFLGFLQALRNESASKLLAEPKLTTSSGKQAFFQVGGEQAVLSGSSGVNGPGAAFQTIGTTLSFLPVVLGNGKIQLTVNPRVRTPNPAFGIQTSFGFVTGFDDKQVSATVEMETGQTFVIGGLIQNETRGIVNKIPVLGDLPFLGVLFSTKEYTETEQEVVILVTPYLVDPQSCDQLPKLLPGQETRSPDDFELFLEGILEAPRGPRKVIQDRKYIPAFKNAKPLDAESGESRVPGNLIFPTRNQENPKPKELPIIENQPVPLPVPIPVPEILKSEKVSEAPPVQIKNSRSSLPIKVLPGVANPNNSESKIKTSSLQTLSPVK
jgi:Flp pilus assembly secretin CpaC